MIRGLSQAGADLLREKVNVLNPIAGFEYMNSKGISVIVAYDTYAENSINTHVLIEPHATGFEVAECYYLMARNVFDAYRVKYAHGYVESDNLKALKLNKQLGYKEITRIPDAVRDGVDYVIMRLTKENAYNNAFFKRIERRVTNG